MSIFKRQHSNENISDIGTQIKIPKPANRLRLLIEQENNNSGKRLHLKGRDTYPISNDLYELTDLEILDLTPEYKSGMAFTISKVPPEFQCLKNLKILHLDNRESFINNILNFILYFYSIRTIHIYSNIVND
ncbi:unnamed protein product [Didymodactylos carnosus]|uniref:Uncharacterized protein n=1 Tax=Didymodactylos carnosus TaxID=1234261 RepID=A0A815JEB8_9BILA|nr:unnamed protein product [Didymodactylos carnosus]CAF4276013.1 unnamed protein product [Didymodactylos carnosus]